MVLKRPLHCFWKSGSDFSAVLAWLAVRGMREPYWMGCSNERGACLIRFMECIKQLLFSWKRYSRWPLCDHGPIHLPGSRRRSVGGSRANLLVSHPYSFLHVQKHHECVFTRARPQILIQFVHRPKETDFSIKVLRIKSTRLTLHVFDVAQNQWNVQLKPFHWILSWLWFELDIVKSQSLKSKGYKQLKHKGS